MIALSLSASSPVTSLQGSSMWLSPGSLYAAIKKANIVMAHKQSAVVDGVLLQMMTTY
jgi:hypothetical protein